MTYLQRTSDDFINFIMVLDRICDILSRCKILFQLTFKQWKWGGGGGGVGNLRQVGSDLGQFFCSLLLEVKTSEHPLPRHTF